MKSLTFFAIGGGLALTALLPQAEPLEAADLKKMVEGLGYTTKLLNDQRGKEKFEFIVKKGGYEVPIAGEVSGDKNTIWFSALLGPAPAQVDKGFTLLKENQRIRPTFFYMTDKGDLMLCVGVDNRGVTSVVAQKAAESIATAVSTTAEIWQ